jgi:hypothetical protein
MSRHKSEVGPEIGGGVLTHEEDVTSAVIPGARMVDAFRTSRSLAGEVRLLESPRPASLECRALTSPATIAAAKSLQGRAYVHQRHLSEDGLTPEGWVPWHDHPPADRVRWFGVFGPDGELVSVGRKVVSDGTGLDSLPAVKIMGVEQPSALASALRDCPPDRVVEPSGVAKLAHAPLIATMLIYQALYQDSVRCGERLWVMTVMPVLRTTLRIVTPGAIRFSPRAVAVLNDYPGMRPQVRAYPAWVRSMPSRPRSGPSPTPCTTPSTGGSSTRGWRCTAPPSDQPRPVAANDGACSAIHRKPVVRPR